MAERDYQAYACDQTFNYLNATTGNGIIVAPTGVGKSHMISGIVRRAFKYRPNARIIMAVHVKELIKQNHEKLIRDWPNAPVGIYSAGLKVKQNYMPITFGGIASMKDKAREFGHTDLVLIDECHRINPNADTMYQEWFAELQKYNPQIRAVGLTATDWRIGNGKLTEPGSFFNDTIVNLASRHNFNRFISEGYLVKLIPRPTQTYLDVSGVAVSGGDYNMTQVQAAVDHAEITWRALQELVHYGQDRRKWLIFASGVEHADHINEMLLQMGIASTVVHRGIPSGERDTRIADFKAGVKYRAMVNANMLTTGYDDTGIDLIAILRPSMSSSLWVQMLGRGIRPHYFPGFNLETLEGRLMAIAASYKQNCLVLDFARNTQNLGPINDPVIPKKASGRGGDPPIKICETQRLKKGFTGCGVYNHPSVQFCDACNAEFDFAIKYSAEASVDALVAEGVDEFQWFNVLSTSYVAHTGPSGKTCLRVDYWVSERKRYTDYIHLEQTGFLLHNAKEWWKARFKHPEWGPPPNVKEALKYANKYYLKEPKQIRVWVNKQDGPPPVVNYEYE